MSENDNFEWNEKHINLSSRLSGIVFHRAGGGHSVQAEGVYQGLPFNFRYQRGFALLEWGRDFYDKPQYKVARRHLDSSNGFLSLGEFKDLFAKMVQLAVRKRAGKEKWM
jgi:hypothetical protein